MRIAAAQSSVHHARGRLAWLAGLMLAAVAVGAGCTALVTGRSPARVLHTRLRTAAVERGYEVFKEGRVRDLLAAPVQWLRSEPPMRLVIDVPFKHMRKIYAQRDEALRVGRLEHEADEYSPASIRVGGRTIPVKLRLKGDLTDHLESHKWSFRIKVRGDAQILGMRRFSVQHPFTRGYQAEPLFFETTRFLGVLTPRYDFVTVTVNGSDLGVMALEEHFAKELQEAGGRKETVIVKFDEVDVWAARDGYDLAGFGGGAFDSYRNAEVVPFGGLVGPEAGLIATYQASAVGLLRGFAKGELAASAAFDPTKLGAYLAAIDAWEAWHAIRWHNLRFSFDPYTARLEPVAFDASLLDSPRLPGSLMSEPIAAAMLADPEVRAAYGAALARLDGALNGGELAARLAEREDAALRALHAEFPLLARYPLKRVAGRAARIARASEPSFPAEFGDRYPRVLRARLVDLAGTTWLELENSLPETAEIRAAAWRGPGGIEPALEQAVPVVLAATRIGEQPTQTSLRLRGHGDALDLQIAVPRLGIVREQTVGRGLVALSAAVVPTSSLDEQLALHPFLQRVEPNVLVIPPGEHRADVSIVVPRGMSLRAEGGATVRFAPAALLIAWGPLDLLGERGNPVVLREIDAEQGWPGIAVLEAGSASTWRHAEVSGTREVELPGWHLTGGTNFYKSELSAHDVTFHDIRGEDALNTINTHFTLERVTVRGTYSDAFDSDFCTGLVRDSSFEDIGSGGGGDAIDFSGSVAEIDGVRFERVSDKAISVGEGSTLRARGVIARRVGAGAVAKDGSTLELEDAVIDDSVVAPLMAYVKKPEFGVARMTARSVRVSGAATRPLVQTGSTLVLEGESLTTEPIDVDALYATAMKKAARP